MNLDQEQDEELAELFPDHSSTERFLTELEGMANVHGDGNGNGEEHPHDEGENVYAPNSPR